MRRLLTTVFTILPFFTWALTPTPSTVLVGAYSLDGAGATLDATTLPTPIGYFMDTGSLDLSNITLTNFNTFGGAGSGGGAGLGGVIFVKSGATVTLSNVNFIANTATGGTGGIGNLGGVLNNFLLPITNGVDGLPGHTASPLWAYGNSGNGGSGSNGTHGLDAVISGFGGSAGPGGAGSDGSPTNIQLVVALGEQAALIESTTQDGATDGLLTADIAAMDTEIAAIQAFDADPFLLAYPIADASVFLTIMGGFVEIDEYLAGNVSPKDAVLLGLQTAFIAVEEVTAYLVSGSSGNGGDGGDGSIGGDGFFGFGGGRGGDGGNGGNAVNISVARGGAPGAGNGGGDGGFGGGGGRGGDVGMEGTNGTFLPRVNGSRIWYRAPGGFGGFGAGDGSQGNVDTESPPAVNGVKGGGGSGFGGAIFLQDGAILNINGPATFCSNFAQGGLSLNGGIAGDALGTDLFMMTGSTVTLNPGLGNTITFAGTIADDSTAGLDIFSIPAGLGAGLILQSGLAILSGENTYSGQTLISGGVLQATDGVGVNAASNINLAGGIFQGSGTLARSLGTLPNRIQFAPGISSGFAAAGGDFFVTLNCGATLTWGSPFFLSSGIPLLFGSSSATSDVTFTNNIDLAGVNQTILVTLGISGTNILSGILSDGSLTIGDPTHTGILELAGANTYLGPTQLSGGTLILSGSLASTSLTINANTTFIDVSGGLANGTTAVVNGTLNLEHDDTISILSGSGTILLNGGTLTIDSGNFPGIIAGTNSINGIIKQSSLTLTLSGANTYLGPTTISGGTLILTGSLQSQTIVIGPGTILNDVNGGLSATSSVTDNGALLLGAAQTIGSLFGTGTISLDFAPLTVGSGDFLGTIFGVNPAFGLTKNTTGTLILSGVSTYVGPTLISQGTLVLQGLGQIGNGPIDIAAGAFLDDLNGGLISTVAITVDGTLNIGANQTLGILSGGSTGVINLNGGSLSVSSGNTAVTIAGTNPLFGLNKISGGTLILSGNSTYIGPTNISAGTLTLTGSLLSPSIIVAVGAILNDNNGSLSAGATLTNSGTVNLPLDDTILLLINSGTINGVGTLTAPNYLLNSGSIINANLGLGTLTSTGTVQLNGTSSASPINIVTGTLTTGPLGSRLLLFPTVNIAGPATLIIEGNEAIGTLTGSGNVNLLGNALSINDGNLSGVISGTILSQLIKDSTGTLILSGANTYIGPTIINAGTLILQGSLLSPFVNIGLGGTLVDVNAGLIAPTLVVEVAGTLDLDVNQTIPTLLGPPSGVVNLLGGNLTINNGDFGGTIASPSPIFEVIKATTGILTLEGGNTYLGPTLINAGTLILEGSLASLNVTVALGATLDDVSGGLSVTSTLINNGIVNLTVNNTISILQNTGILNGPGTLTATTYLLNNGSIINANLGPGTIDSNGIVVLNGTTSASIINVLSGSLILGAPGGRLLLAPSVDVSVGGDLVLTGNETVSVLSGGGIISLQGYILTVESGNVTGMITGNINSELVKISGGTLVLSGNNTYLGPTQINVGTLTLIGTLESEIVNIAAGAILNDVNGGLSGLTALTNNGILVLSANDNVASLVNTGSILGPGFTLTAATYLLENGSNITVNLGTGVLTTTGNVTVSGTIGANIVNISVGSTLNLIGDQRLSNTVILNVNGILNSPTFNETIGILNGNGGNVFINNLQINNGGTFINGQINASSLLAGGGILNLTNTIVNVPSFTLDTGATVNISGPITNVMTGAITISGNSNLTIFNNAVINNTGDTIIEPNGLLNVLTGGKLLNTGNITLGTNGIINLDAASLISANQIITEVNSTIIVPNSAALIYNVLTGSGTINSLGNTFVNLTTVSGNLTFIDSFTNLGTFGNTTTPGLVIIGGNYIEGGHLTVDIFNVTPIIGYPQVRVGGTITLLPSSEFDVTITANALVAGNFFQILANSVGGPIFVGGVLGNLVVNVDGTPSNPAVLIFDNATGRLVVTGVPPGPPPPGPPPGPPGPPIPPPPNPLFSIGCTPNQNRVAKAVFTEALIGPFQIDTNTVAGKLALAILSSSNHCTALSPFVPKHYGSLSDYAILGDRALASKVWDSVSVFSSLPEICCPKFSVFTGLIDSEARHLHGSHLQRQDIYVGVDFSNCKGFSIGVAATDSVGKIHSSLGKIRAEGNAGLFYIRKNLGKYFMAYGTASGSFQDDHMRRETLFGHVKGHTKTQSYTTNLGLRYRGWRSKHWGFAPRINVVYSHAHVDGFSEEGALDALHDSGFTAQFFTGEIGFSSLFSGQLFTRPLDIEAVVGVEQPFMYQKKAMRMYVVADPNIDYSVSLAQTAKTRISGGLNVGYNIFKTVTVFGSYEVISGGDWNHVAYGGIRICLGCD